MPLSPEQMANFRRKPAAEPVAEDIGPEDYISGKVAAPRSTVAQSAAVDGFEFFRAQLDPAVREDMTEAELRAIYEAQLKDALAERKALRKKAATAQAAHAARMAAGLVSTDAVEAMETLRHNSQITSLQIELPPSGEQGEVCDIGLRIDGRIYLHGRRYDLTEAQAASMRETLYRIGDMEQTFKGQNKAYRAWLMGRAMGRDRHVR
jgi:hypothetical protein